MHPKYKKMLRVMQEKEEKSRCRAKREPWLLYILGCNDGSLYTGITNNLERRLKTHNDGRASRFTRTRRPVKLLYQESCLSRTRALVRECEVKSYPRKKKEDLIQSAPSEKTPQPNPLECKK